MKTRIITGLIFGTILIGGVLFSEDSKIFLLLFITGACLWEYFQLVLAKDGNLKYRIFRYIISMFIGFIPFMIRWNNQYTEYVESPYRWLFFSIMSLLGLELWSASARPFENIGLILLGTFYIGISLSLGLDLNRFELLSVLFLVWVTDVFAYFVGSQMGKTPFFPRISPKKTWEGIIGGLVGGALTAFILSFTNFAHFSLGGWLILGLACSFLGTTGDLVESMLKRSIGIKDSGSIFPGHGGFLDRFDAFIFALPFAVLLIDYLR